MSFIETPRFPEDISYGSSGGPEYLTRIVVTGSGHERRNAAWSEARARYDVAYGVRTPGQLAALLAFFRARRGRAEGFRYKDWADYSSAADGVGTPLPGDQLLGLGDGATLAFQLVKAYGGRTRPIAKPVAGSLRLALDGVEQASGWALDATRGQVTFVAPPAAGVAVSAGFLFDVPVRFDSDWLPLRLEAYGGDAESVPLLEVRP